MSDGVPCTSFIDLETLVVTRQLYNRGAEDFEDWSQNLTSIFPRTLYMVRAAWSVWRSEMVS